MDKEAKKSWRRQAAFIALRGFTFLHGVLPLGWSYFLGSVLGTITYFFLFHHRRVAMESLGIAFEKMPVKDKKKITRDFFVFMAQSGLETLYFLKNPRVLDNVRIEGLEHLRRAQAQGRGIILLTAHLGNFPLLSMKLASLGFVNSFVTRPMRDRRAGNYLHNLRTKAGVKTIFSYPRRECVNGIIKALRSNEAVLIQMDQNFGTGGVWVNFFGKLAATPVGPIVFALRTQAAVLPAYIYRESKGRHCVKIMPREEIVMKEDKDETVLVNAVRFSRIIEDWIRKHPSQWGWIHRRWKSRPSQKVIDSPFKVEAG